MRTLVIEDDRYINRTVCEILDLEGYVADFAETVSDAIRKLHATPYDVVLLDWSLQGEPGEEILPMIAAMAVRPAVVLYSVHAGAQRVATKWSVPFMRKPFEVEGLLATLRSAADGPGLGA